MATNSGMRGQNLRALLAVTTMLLPLLALASSATTANDFRRYTVRVVWGGGPNCSTPLNTACNGTGAPLPTLGPAHSDVWDVPHLSSVSMCQRFRADVLARWLGSLRPRPRRR
jgi:hypothetical protein